LSYAGSVVTAAPRSAIPGGFHRGHKGSAPARMRAPGGALVVARA